MTAALVASRPRHADPHAGPVVWIRPAPRLEPAFDDERATTPEGPCPGQLDLLSVNRQATKRPPAAPVAAGEAPAPRQAVGAGSAGAGSAGPDVRHALRWFVEACVEVLNGYRPVAHLRPHASATDFNQIAAHLTRRATRVRLVTGARTADSRVSLRRLRVCEPRDGVAEAAVVLDHRGGSWAMAIRLERHRGRWICTLLQVI
jgi:hypothetical protein